MSTVRTVLLDADGVIQRTRPEFRSALMSLVSTDQDQFLSDVFRAERGPLIGDGRFEDTLADVLSDWRVKRDVHDVMKIWASIDVIPGLDTLLAELRNRQLRVCLASNQQAHRAGVMNDQLGFAERFDSCFYSYELGVRKPDTGYFRAILERLELEPHEALFVDDNGGNVEAAREVGLVARQFHIADHGDDPAGALGQLIGEVIA